MSSRSFALLLRVWCHAAISVTRKIDIFNSLILSKLRYGLAAVWLGIAEQRRLDGFHCRCLRRILRIQPTFISRTSNETVLQRAGQSSLSKMLLKDQLLLLGKVASQPPTAVMRKARFYGDSFVPRTAAFVRKVGRPRHTWAEQLLNIARGLVGANMDAASALCDWNVWRQTIAKF